MNDQGRKTLAGLAGALSAVGVGALVYGVLVESNRLVVKKHTLRLPRWPAELAGFRIALLGDFHIGTRWSLDLAQRAVFAALAEAPDMVVLIGDYVNYWKPDRIGMVGRALEPLRLLHGDVIAVPGNHEYAHGDADLLQPVMDEFNIKFLRNDSIEMAGITWIGIDSARTKYWDVEKSFEEVSDDGSPRIVLWHEPDFVDKLPGGCALQLSGHGHGGQFRLPFGFAPVRPPMGEKYPGGYYPDAPTPLFVTSGVGTTGPPSRFLCPPEVAILRLLPA